MLQCTVAVTMVTAVGDVPGATFDLAPAPPPGVITDTPTPVARAHSMVVTLNVTAFSYIARLTLTEATVHGGLQIQAEKHVLLYLVPQQNIKFYN